MQAPAQQPHRPGPLHQSNKVHKGGRHSRKASATSEIKNKTLIKPIAKVRREDRLNQASQNRKLKRDRAIEDKRKLGTEYQPPLLIGILDLHTNSCKSFFSGLKDYSEDDSVKIKPINDREVYIMLPKLKLRFKFIVMDSTNFDETIDIVKTLDIMILLHHPRSVELEEDSASQLLRAIHIHCLPTTVHIIHALADESNIDAATSKHLLNAKRILKSKIDDDKVHSIERTRDYMQMFHLLGNCRRQKSHFKESRATVVPDRVDVAGDSLVFTGFLRNRNLSPNSLVNIVGYDDYQIEKIEVLTDVLTLRSKNDEELKVEQELRPDPMKQETLDQENDIDPMEGEQTWPTAEELAAEAERKNVRTIVKKLPPGTSEYQGAWIPEESDEEAGASDESDDSDGDARMQDIVEDEEDEDYEEEDDQIEEDDQSTNQQDGSESVMDVDDYDKKNSTDKEMKILEKIREARLEEMFPDEVETPHDVPARVRFARYRGLKSFRTSPWDPQENLPPEYSRIFQFQNFNQTKKRVLARDDEDGVEPGRYVRVYVAKVPQQAIEDILNRQVPPYLVGLLKHERKMTVMNILIKRVPGANLSHPVKSKDELIFYVGFRKFKARPLLTTHSSSSKFKYERFLRDDNAMVATIYAPITFPPAPVLVFRANYRGERQLIASGSVLDSNPNRTIIKRIRLSGHPFKIHSKTAVARFMFFNSEDVMYFKPVELSTRYNRRGHITEPLGTHGHMKCIFDRKIRSDDCIFMNLYKRVFPKWNYTPLFAI